MSLKRARVTIVMEDDYDESDFTDYGVGVVEGLQGWIEVDGLGYAATELIMGSPHILEIKVEEVAEV